MDSKWLHLTVLILGIEIHSFYHPLVSWLEGEKEGAKNLPGTIGNDADAQTTCYLERQIDSSACGTLWHRPIINLIASVVLEVCAAPFDKEKNVLYCIQLSFVFEPGILLQASAAASWYKVTHSSVTKHYFSNSAHRPWRGEVPPRNHQFLSIRFGYVISACTFWPRFWAA